MRIHPLFKLTDRSQGFGVDAIPGQRQPQLVVETHRDRWDQKPVEDVEALGPRQAYLAKEFGSSLSGSASTKGAIYRMRLLLSPAILESTRNLTTLTPTLWPTSCNPTLDVQFNLPRRTTSDSYSRAPLTQGRPGTSSQHRTLCSEPQMVGSSNDPPPCAFAAARAKCSLMHPAAIGSLSKPNDVVSLQCASSLVMLDNSHGGLS